jgi:hypothetical protein
MPRKQPITTSSRLSIIRMPRVTKAKQLSIMKPDTTKRRPIMHTPQGDTRFTRGITRTKPQSLTWRTAARNSHLDVPR